MKLQSIKRYEAYKDSGIEWLGKVPAHWTLDRLKNLTKTQSGTTPQSGSSKYYDGGTNYWVRTTDLNNGRLFKSEFKITDLALDDCGLKTIPVNSVLLAMYGGMGTIGKNSLLQKAVTINQSVCAILPHEKCFNSIYLWYYVQYFRPIWEMFADSARKDPNINQEAIKRLWVILPSLPEQTAIANYLDTKTAQIDRQIDLLSKKSTQYNKLKQALINETITRGLDKSVAMKDSGVEWIGEIPAHWLFNRHKDNFSFVSDRCANSSLTKVGLENIEGKTGRFISTDSEFDGDGVEFKQNDILFGKLRPYLAKVYLAEFNGNAVGDIFVYRMKKCITSNFAQYLMLSDRYIDVINSSTAGAKMPRVSSNFIANLPTPTPPLYEQQAIAEYLDQKTAHIVRIVTSINTQVAKLKELRLTLINDVVTGKIKITNEVV